MKKFFLWAIVALLVPASATAAKVKISVSNDQKAQRQEVVEVDATAVYKQLGIQQGEPFVVKNALGQEVGYQLTYDGRLLLDVAVRPCGTAVFTVEPGRPQPAKVDVTGRQHHERGDARPIASTDRLCSVRASVLSVSMCG